MQMLTVTKIQCWERQENPFIHAYFMPILFASMKYFALGINQLMLLLLQFVVIEPNTKLLLQFDSNKYIIQNKPFLKRTIYYELNLY